MVWRGSHDRSGLFVPGWRLQTVETIQFVPHLHQEVGSVLVLYFGFAGWVENIESRNVLKKQSSILYRK